MHQVAFRFGGGRRGWLAGNQAKTKIGRPSRTHEPLSNCRGLDFCLRKQGITDVRILDPSMRFSNKPAVPQQCVNSCHVGLVSKIIPLLSQAITEYIAPIVTDFTHGTLRMRRLPLAQTAFGQPTDKGGEQACPIDLNIPDHSLLCVPKHVTILEPATPYFLFTASLGPAHAFGVVRTLVLRVPLATMA